MRTVLLAKVAFMAFVAVAADAHAQPLVAAGPAISVVADGDAVVRFSGMGGHQYDWISIATPGSAPTDYVAWQYTAGRHEGTLTFTGLAAGRWVARAFFGSATYEVRAESTPFALADRCSSMDPTVRVTSDGAKVYVRFSGLCGAATDWIAIAAADAPAPSYQAWRYTNGAREGVMEFEGLPPGRYEARVFLDWAGTSSYGIRAHSAPFWVAPAGCVCGDAAVQRSATPARK